MYLGSVSRQNTGPFKVHDAFMEGALLDLRSRLERTPVTVAGNNYGETVAQASSSSSRSSFPYPPSANGQLTPPLLHLPNLTSDNKLSTRLHFRLLAAIASFESTAFLCFYDIGPSPTYLQNPHAQFPYFCLQKSSEEKPATVSRAHSNDQDNANSIDEGRCSISHLITSHWEGLEFTFRCGLIGLLADSSDQNSRCFGKCVPATPRGPNMRLDATSSHCTCLGPKFLMIPTKFAPEQACWSPFNFMSCTASIPPLPSLPSPTRRNGTGSDPATRAGDPAGDLSGNQSNMHVTFWIGAIKASVLKPVLSISKVLTWCCDLDMASPIATQASERVLKSQCGPRSAPLLVRLDPSTDGWEDVSLAPEYSSSKCGWSGQAIWGRCAVCGVIPSRIIQ